MAEKYANNEYTTTQLAALVTLRILIGWHFLYEGLTKLVDPYWSSALYLLDSQWSFFLSIVANPLLLSLVDFLNIWGLILIGACLIAGLLTRTMTIAGIFLLFLYYISNPPFIGLVSPIPAEGNYLIVNKTLIELVALFVLTVFPTGHHVGLDIFIFRLGKARKGAKIESKKVHELHEFLKIYIKYSLAIS